MKSKQFLMLLIAVLSVAILQSQTVNIPRPAGGATYQEVTTSYVMTNTTVRNVWFHMPQDVKSVQDYTVRLDSLAGNHTAVTVVFNGAKSYYSTPVALDTVVWARTTKDTTITISTATANRYRYYLIKATGTGTGVTGITRQELKLWLE